jgi:hypothetical protein
LRVELPRPVHYNSPKFNAVSGQPTEESPMSTLVVIDYESEMKAEEVRLALLKM